MINSPLYPMTGGLALHTQRGAHLKQPPQSLNGQPKQLFFPLQSNYCLYTPLIKTGETVSAGQAIAIARQHKQGQKKEQLSQQIHTGLAGIASVQKNCISIVVHDSQYTHPDQQKNEQEQPPATVQKLQSLLCSQGIIGLGGAMFPTGNKLQSHHLISPKHPTMHTLLVNGVECEPMLTADACLMTHYPSRILKGINSLLNILNIPRAIFAIEEDKPFAITTISHAITHSQSTLNTNASQAHIDICKIQTLYPAGGSRQLYEQIFGDRLQALEHSTQRGVLTLNVHTIAAIADALEGKPLTHRLVTLTGLAIDSPRNVWLPIGTPLHWIQSQMAASIQTQEYNIIYGGPLMGHIVTHKNEPIQAGTTAVIFEPKKTQLERPCIQCGDCNPVCPEALQPHILLQALNAKKVQQHNPSADQTLEDFKLNNCILCGACDVVCPSFIPLASLFKEEQKNLQQRQKRAASAHRAQLNYDISQARRAKPARANPPKLALDATIKSTQTKTTRTKATRTSTRLKTQLAKAKRLHKESAAALAQAQKKQLDKTTLQQYQDRVHTMQLKAEIAQKALIEAQSAD